LKGKAAPELAFRLEGAVVRKTALIYRSAMVGREAELARLDEFLKPVPSGRFPGLAYVFGEAGMGKTRLIQELRRRLEQSERTWTWIHMACLERDSGLKPITTWLEGFFGLETSTSQAEKRAKIEAKIEAKASLPTTPEETRTELRRMVSFLAALVTCEWEGSPYSLLADPRLRHENQLWAVKEVVKALAFESPLVLEIEDAHWIEPSTAGWLKIMTRNAADVPFAVILTSRHVEDAGAIHELPLQSRNHVPVERDVPVVDIELGRLDEAFIRRMFEQRLRKAPSPGLLEFLKQKTDGNPFFVEQLVAHLKGSGLLADGPDGMVLREDIGRLPATLESLLTTRFDRLEPELREGLKHAATLGVRFLRNVLEELLRRSDQFAGEPKTIVPAAEEEGMVVPAWSRKTADSPGGIRAEDAFLFRHALMQKAAYHLQIPSVRASLHRLAAEVIEEFFPDRPEFCRELAEHYANGGMPEKEMLCLEGAATHAAENYENQEAIQLYKRLISRLKADRQRTPQVRIARARYALAAVLDLVGRWTEAIEEYKSGLSILDRGACDAPTISADVVNGEDAPRAGSSEEELTVDGQVRLSGMYRQQGNMKQAIEIGQSAFALAERLGYLKGKAAAMGNVGNVYKDQGEYVRATECYQQRLRIAEELGDKAGTAQTVGNMGIVCYLHGDHVRAMECFEKKLQLSMELGDRAGRANAVGNMGHVYWRQGDYARAMECYQERLRLSEELGDKAGRAGSVNNMGNVYGAQGDNVRAMECYQELLRLAEEIGDKAGRSSAIGNMGTIYKAQGDHAHAMQCYEKHLQLAEELGDKAGKARVIGNMGNVYESQGDYPRALECYKQRLQLAEEIGDKTEKARAIGNIGTVYFSQGDNARAMECCQQSLHLSEETGDKVGMAAAVGNMASVCQEQGDHARAMECYQRFLQLADKLGSRNYTAMALVGIGTVLAKTGDHDHAIEKLSAAIVLWEELKSRQEMTTVLVALAEAHLGRASVEGERVEHRASDLAAAREALQKARALAEEFKQKKQLEEIARVQKLLDDSKR
jgi:tetratricopeptide (TPR) repeat protein